MPIPAILGEPGPEILLGALCKPILEQISLQGFYLPIPANAERWQRLADALVLLYVHGFLTESARSSAQRKLLREISKGVAKVPRSIP